MLRCSRCGKFSMNVAVNRDGLCYECELETCELNIDTGLLERSQKLAEEAAASENARAINAPGALILPCRGTETLIALGANLVVEKKGSETAYPIAQLKSFEIGRNVVKFSVGAPNSGGIIVAGMLAGVGGEILLTYSPKNEAAAAKVRAYVRDYRPEAAAPAANPADELRQFKALLDDGIINQAEFDAKKAKILGL